MTIVIERVAPLRVLSNGDAPPVGSGLIDRFGLIRFGDISPRGRSAVREMRFEIPNLQRYVVSMALYEADPSAPTPDAGVLPDAAGSADAGVGRDASAPNDAGSPARIDTSFGALGYSFIGVGTPTLVTRLGSWIVVGMSSPNRIVRVDPATGQRDMTLGGRGEILLDAADHTCDPRGVVAAGTDHYVILCRAQSAAFFGGNGDLADRRSIATGDLDPTFGTAGTVILWAFDRTRGLPTNDGGMYIWYERVIARNAGLRRLDAMTGAVTGLPGAVPSNGGLFGAMGWSGTGSLVLALGDRRSIAITDRGTGVTYQTTGGGPGVQPTSVASDHLGRPAYGFSGCSGASGGYCSITYFVDPSCPPGVCPTDVMRAHQLNASGVFDLAADSSGRFYIASSAGVPGFLARVDPSRPSGYDFYDSTFGNTGINNGNSFQSPGLTVLRLIFDAPTNSIYYVGVAVTLAGHLGETYVGKIEL